MRKRDPDPIDVRRPRDVAFLAFAALGVLAGVAYRLAGANLRGSGDWVVIGIGTGLGLCLLGIALLRRGRSSLWR
jgi:hypothetical protein